MPMTKKERAAVDAELREAGVLLTEARTLAALRWTSPVAPDVPPPPHGYSEGWDFNAPSGSVWLGWSTSVSHGTGPAPKDGKHPLGGSQCGRAMYSTQVLALAALRREIERRAAVALRTIDEQLEAAQPKEPGA